MGDLSVAVTNAGDYVFLLGKGVGYSLSVFPATATNFSYAAVDDIPSGLSFQSPPDSPSGEWTVDRGRLEIVPPVYPMTLYTPRSRAMWTPCLSVSPSTWQPSALDDTETFTAVLSDIPPFASVSYRWNTSDPGVVSVASPNSKTTSMTYVPPSGEAGFPSLSLVVGVDEATLRSYFSHDWSGAGGNAVSFTVSAPEVLFVNDDDDNDDGTPDVLATPHLDDDVASGCILLHSPVPVSGVVTIEGAYGYDEGFGDSPLLFADELCTEGISEGRSFAVTQETEWSKAIYLNPATASTTHPGVQVKARWHPSEGPDLTASAFATIVSPRAEPVCNATTNVVENGEAHEYTVNPCGVGIGRVGHFRVEVAPDSFPDDKIVWEKTDGLDFVGSCTGRCVSVRGVSEGVATLAVKVGDCRSDAPTFDVEVVQNVTVNLRAWIITGAANMTAKTPEDVRGMVKDANDIYAQVGVTLNLIEPIVVTNIPNAYDALYETPTNATSTWSFDQIVDIASDTGGLECYFINSFTDSDDTLAANSRKGTVVTRDADFRVLAHEIGHVFGMCDIYATSDRSDDSDAPLLALLSSDMVSFSHMSNDWNGGCHGKGAGGARYYKYNTKMTDILPRMLMNGRRKDSDNPIDITSGDIYGVYHAYDENNEKTWHKGDAPTAFLFGNRNITHQ